MTIASNLQRIIDAKAAIRTAIQEKGVAVPDDEKLDAYHEYIDQISTGGGIYPPDLSKVLTAEDFDNIQNIIDAGKVSEYFNLGDVLKVTFGSLVMPFEVVGWEDVKIEGGQTVPALNLLMNCCSNGSEQYVSASLGIPYSQSGLRSAIIGAVIQGSCDPEFVSRLATTEVQTYAYGNKTDTVYDKMFAPSAAQLGATSGDAYHPQDGHPFSSYQNATNTQRIRYWLSVRPTDAPQAYWTRSFWGSFQSKYTAVDAQGSFSGNANSYYNAMVAACNLIGKGV